MRLQFDRSVKLVFRGTAVSSDGGLLLHRELDDAPDLTGLAAGFLAEPRARNNGRHDLAALLRQSIFSRPAGYEDVNDADRLRHDSVMQTANLTMPPRLGLSAMRFRTLVAVTETITFV